jgi:hypothetical protein
MVPVGHVALATVRVLDREPQRVPLCPSVFGIGWNAFSKNRVEPAAAA